MPTTKTKSKPAARSAEPKPTLVVFPRSIPTEDAPPDDSAEIADRSARLDAYAREAKELNTLARFPKLDAQWDGTCVLALADLFAYGSHSEASLDDTSNWLGRFFSEVLLEVAANGTEWANAHPEFVKLEFHKAIEELRNALSFCRDIEAKMPPSVLEEIEKWPAPAEQ